MDWLFNFPFKINIDTNAIDNAVRGFAASHSAFFDGIKSGLTGFVGAINWILGYIPWFVLIALVFFLGWKGHKSLRSGITYAVLLCVIGTLGLWDLMNLTLSIVLAGVIIALVLGLPVGVLLSGSDRANRTARPLLDMMQTMPVFVYLIPAVIFFGMGSASAVIATVIYAMVPVIRLTSLGIRQVNAEVVEAARSFGSTKLQMLLKVQMPQALPTIMAGINQTMMMAMSMVVTCSMIGARGLGNEVLIAVNRVEISRGFMAGGSVVILAILLDRLTQGWFSSRKESGDE
ncbi:MULTISPECIES: ABC transporter permease [unclassified Oscillibacter]|uniref:ABC transporter permease n=1 Tax=unclassified Oscillibacter TaxID=2629304 RepID=UPI0025E23EDD|nr:MULTISPECIES: ABC transporter permease subunit [unclassified Oscillibacter]